MKLKMIDAEKPGIVAWCLLLLLFLYVHFISINVPKMPNIFNLIYLEFWQSHQLFTKLVTVFLLVFLLCLLKGEPLITFYHSFLDSLSLLLSGFISYKYANSYSQTMTVIKSMEYPIIVFFPSKLSSCFQGSETKHLTFWSIMNIM